MFLQDARLDETIGFKLQEYVMHFMRGTAPCRQETRLSRGETK